MTKGTLLGPIVSCRASVCRCRSTAGVGGGRRVDLPPAIWSPRRWRASGELRVRVRLAELCHCGPHLDNPTDRPDLIGDARASSLDRREADRRDGRRDSARVRAGAGVEHADTVAHIAEELVRGAAKVLVVLTVQSDATMLMVRDPRPQHSELGERPSAATADEHRSAGRRSRAATVGRSGRRSPA